MNKHTEETDARYTAEVIKRKLHETGLTQADLGRRLHLSRAGISRAMSRPNGMRTHLEQVAHALGCEMSELVPAKVPDRNQIRALFGQQIDEGHVRLNAGCLIKRLSDKQRQRMDGAVWLLLQSTSSKPLDGALVLLTTKDGTEHLRDFYRDANDKSTVVLMSHDKAERPLVIKDDDIQEIRMVIAPLASLPH